MSDTDHTPSEQEQPDDDKITPRGATAFVFVMLAGYIIYWAYLWHSPAVTRGQS
ncbi:MAG: hypothetical protein ABIQ99_11190 [Thermoflexales bacterium]